MDGDTAWPVVGGFENPSLSNANAGPVWHREVVMMSLARLRERGVLAEQMVALRARGESDRRDFYKGALDALRWLTEGGSGPLTGAVGGPPVSARAVVRELAAAEELIYGRPSTCRDYACGLEHALMWAQFATAAAPVPARPGPWDTGGRSVGVRRP